MDDSVTIPSDEEIRALGAEHHVPLTDAEVEAISGAIEAVAPMFERLTEMADTGSEPPSDLASSQRAGPKDPYNAFVRRCDVGGSESGSLSGYTVALKDNIPVAGVEMTCGSAVLEGYTPSTDATVVSRLLDAGARITGKANMDAMALAPTGGFSDFGDVLNPRDPTHLAGGSSGGSAAAVAAGDVDVALGTDQAGSIRIPAACCGVVGFKPSFGAVPYTGIVSVGPTFDHVGPMASDVAGCRRAYDVLAGDDGLDTRCSHIDRKEAGSETDALVPADVEVGVLEEGFGHESSRAAVDRTVREALDAVAAAGPTVAPLSVPEHDDGFALWSGVATEETASLMDLEGMGRFRRGRYDLDFLEAFAAARRDRGEAFPLTYKLRLVLGGYLTREYLGKFYATAQNVRRSVTAAYDTALDDVDVLAMPTIPRTAPERMGEVAPDEVFPRIVGYLNNTAPFDVSGHPAISLPCGTVDGLPVGLMLVGDRSADRDLLEVAQVVERVLERE